MIRTKHAWISPEAADALVAVALVVNKKTKVLGDYDAHGPGFVVRSPYSTENDPEIGRFGTLEATPFRNNGNEPRTQRVAYDIRDDGLYLRLADSDGGHVYDPGEIRRILDLRTVRRRRN